MLFLIYINDITNDLESNAFLFADDTSCFKSVLNGNMQEAAHLINSDLEKIYKWTKQWFVTINASKTVVMLFSRKQYPSKLPQMSIGDSPLNQVDNHKHLGITFTEKLSWSKHIDGAVSKCNRMLGILKDFKYKWPRIALEISYNSFTRPVLEYGNIIYDNCTKADSNNIESVQQRHYYSLRQQGL